jgi:hypothetical protein
MIHIWLFWVSVALAALRGVIAWSVLGDMVG